MPRHHLVFPFVVLILVSSLEAMPIPERKPLGGKLNSDRTRVIEEQSLSRRTSREESVSALEDRGEEGVAASPTLTKRLDNDAVVENHEAPNMDDFIAQAATPHSSPFIGTIGANAVDTKAPVGGFNRHSIEQVNPQGTHIEKPPLSFGQLLENMEVITGSGFNTLAPMMVDGAADQIERLQEEYRQKFNNSSNDPERACFRDVMEVLENALSYKNSFLKREIEIAKERAIQQGPAKSTAATVVKALMIRGPILERNIDKLLSAAKRVEDLHQQTAELMHQRETPNLPSELSADFDNLSTITQQAIQQELLYSQKVKEGDFSTANAIKEKNAYLISKRDYSKHSELLYNHLEDQRRAGAISQNDAAFTMAACYARAAGKFFDSALEPGIPDQTRDAYIQAGNYHLKSAELIVTGRRQEALKYKLAALITEGACESFESALKPGTQAEIRDTYIQAGNYRLKSAELIVTGRRQEAQNFEYAACTAASAIDDFRNAFQPGTQPEIRDAYIRAGNYHLKAAEFLAEGKVEEARNFQDAASEAHSSL